MVESLKTFVSSREVEVINTPELLKQAKGGSYLTGESNLYDVLSAMHPVRAAMERLWKIYVDFYEGVGIEKYLHRHLRESEKSIEERRKRAYYLNYIEQIVRIYSGFLFKQPVVRKVEPSDSSILSARKRGVSDIFHTLFENIDGLGRSIDEFMKEVCLWNLVYGTQFVLIDVPKVEVMPANMKELKVQKVFPYAVRFDPYRAINWAVDEGRNFIWIRFKEDPPPVEDPFSERLIKGEEYEECYYKTWTRNEWIRHRVIKDKEKTFVEEVDRGTHGLGIVPVVVLKNRDYSGSSVIGLSFIHDIVFISMAILNVCSLLDEEMYQKALTLLAIQKTPDEVPDVEIGTNNVITYSGQPPFFISPSLTPGDFFLRVIEVLSGEIFRLSRLAGGITMLREALSGLAYAYIFNETNQSLSDQADILEDAEKKILSIMGRWMGFSPDDLVISVSYPDDFGLVDVAREIEILKSTRDTIPSLTLYKELAKDVSQVLLQGKSERSVIKKVIEEIEQRGEDVFIPPNPFAGTGWGGEPISPMAQQQMGEFPSEVEGEEAEIAQRIENLRKFVRERS